MQKKMFVIRVLGHSPFEEKKKDELAFFFPVVPFPPPPLPDLLNYYAKSAA